MILIEDDGEYEVDAEDVELEPDGSGFWLLADEDDEFEEFYEFVD